MLLGTIASIISGGLIGFNAWKLYYGKGVYWSGLRLFLGAAPFLLLYYKGPNALFIVAASAWLFRRMRCIGLTGSIASGKTSVSKALADKGFTILDLDKYARDVVDPGTPAFQAIVAKFGLDVLQRPTEASVPTLNRAKLRELIMRDDSARRFMNSVTHPAIYRKLLWNVMKHRVIGGKNVIIDAPLLFESGWLIRILTSPVIVVYAPLEIQKQRLMKRDKMTSEQAEKMISIQFSVEKKASLGDLIFDNSVDIDNFDHAKCNSFQKTLEEIVSRL